MKAMNGMSGRASDEALTLDRAWYGVLGKKSASNEHFIS
jgi:hypothetical protein